MLIVRTTRSLSNLLKGGVPPPPPLITRSCFFIQFCLRLLFCCVTFRGNLKSGIMNSFLFAFKDLPHGLRCIIWFNVSNILTLTLPPPPASRGQNTVVLYVEERKCDLKFV